MDKDRLLEILQSNENINLLKTPESKDGNFSRWFEFEIRDQLYKVEWYVNISYLNIGEAVIPFISARIDGCWPNNYKNNLNLIYNENTAVIIPLEEYKK